MVWETLNGMSEETLNGTFTYRTTKGVEHTNNVLSILLHVVNHGTDHRAQILAMLQQVGGRTAEQDLLGYIR